MPLELTLDGLGAVFADRIFCPSFDENGTERMGKSSVGRQKDGRKEMTRTEDKERG